MVEKLNTYLNKNGYPIIRRCFNCKHWKGDIQIENSEKPLGYCKFSPLYFAFTLQPTVYPITKDFYLCEHHEFDNEQKLAENCEQVSLKDSIKKKDDIS
jgi:hypothetical protein